MATNNPAGRAGTRGRDAASPWQMPLAGWKDVALRTWRESSADNVSIVAAGVAFYGFLAMVPMLGAGILLYGLAADPRTVVSHARDLSNFMPGEVAKLVAEQLINVVTTSDGKKGLGLIVAIAVAIWGARNAASSIITALNIAYEETEKRSFIRVTLLSLVMTLGAIVLAFLAGAAVALLSALEHLIPGLGGVGVVLGKVLTYALLGGIAAAAAATMFRYAPSRDEAKWTWITPGSLFFAGVWILLTLAFGFYVSQFGNYGATYGSLSAVVVLLTWLYLSSFVLLLGAELNSELEHQTTKDTTAGQDLPLGQRGAWVADNVADAGPAPQPDKEEPGQRAADIDAAAEALQAQRDAERPSAAGAYVAGRLTNRAGTIGGLRNVGIVSAILSTAGLSLMRKRGRTAAGAALLATAAGISLLKRDD